MFPLPRVYRFALCAGLLLALWCPSSRARAEEPFRVGMERFAAADFSAALQAFKEAESGDGLSRDQLLKLLYTRTLIHAALGDNDATRADLSALASLHPDHKLGPEAPPEMRALFAELVAGQPALSVQASARREGKVVHLDCEIDSDVAGLAREVRLSARGADQPRFKVGLSPLVLSVAPSLEVYYFAELLGPGGAVLARHGTLTRPLVLEAARPKAPAVPATPAPRPPKRKRRAWIGWLVGGVAVVAGASVGIWFATRPDDVTMVVPEPVMRALDGR